MRFAALLCGLAAGLLLLALPRQAGIDLMPAFLKLWHDTPNQQLVAQLLWYAIPVSAVLGGLLVWFVPGLAALLLLLSGLGWAGIELVLPNEFQVLTPVPAVACILGSIFAYAAGEIASRRRREQRSRRRDDYSLPSTAGRDPEIMAREAALRMDPLTMERRPSAPQPMAPSQSSRPRYDIPLTLEDANAAQRRDEPVVVAVGPPEPTIGPVAAPSGGGGTRPYVHPAVQRGRSDARSDVASVQAAPLQPPTPMPAPQRSGFVVWFAVLNGVVLALLGLGVGYLLVERGVDPRNTALTGAPSAIVSSASSGTGGPTGATSAASSSGTGRFSDPFTYCAAIGTIDRVDQRYDGPYVIEEMAETLHIPVVTSPDRVRWRCANGLVLACTSFGWPICDKTPDTAEMLAFCQRNNDVARLLAPNGTWSCKAGKPEIPADASWPVDDRGFLPNAWQPVLKADPPAAAGG